MTNQIPVQRPHKVRVDIEFPSMDHYLAVQRELSAGKIRLDQFAGAAVMHLFNQLVEQYKRETAAAEAALAETSEDAVSSDTLRELTDEQG